MMRLPFMRAILKHREGDSSALIAYLRSDKPLDWGQRWDIAALFEPKPEVSRRGRPQKKEHRLAASVAKRFYEDWKQYNKHNGITAHGHAREMKDRALEFTACKLHPNWRWIWTGAGERDTALQMMERGKSRRNSG